METKTRLLRSASLVFQYAGKRLLVDPMFAKAGSLPAIPNSPNPRPNPLVEIPVDLSSIVPPDAVLLTHSHPDHFDETAAGMLPKDILFFCQPEDASLIAGMGFTHVHPIETHTSWEGITISRTRGQHGVGEIGRMMGPVSGFVFESAELPTIYFTGDTIWCDEVKQAVDTYQPDVIVAFAGNAQFLEGGPIIMTKEDVAALCEASPHSRIIVAHMETWNHCLLSRMELKAYLAERQLTDRVLIPDDGEELTIGAGRR